MQKIYLTLLTLFFSLGSIGQTDGILLRKNFIYINPLFFSSDVLQLNDYWASVGYDRKLNERLLAGINISTIVASQPSTGVFYGPGLNAFKSNGIRLNVEAKYLAYKRFYTSINLFYQGTKMFCKEDAMGSAGMYVNNYYVFRDAYSLIPKVGFILNKKEGFGFYWDLSWGMGVKYITSTTKGKINELSDEREAYSAKVFEYGQGYTYHPLFHLKVGYNF
ncbi:MAG TPA: hypothetical protein VGC65_01060 [Bacteroidia bacterium]|jgi:hypothetical protein